MTHESGYDVVVVGGGGAGMAAAVTAAEEGASVLLAEAGDELGGSTALSGGSFMAAGTAVQAEAGYPDDTVDAFFAYYLTFNRWSVEPAVARRFCEQAAPTLEWLTGLGVAFRADGLYRAGLETVPRSHRPVGAGAAIVAALQSAVRKHGIDLALGRRVDALKTVGGRVCGIRSGDDEVDARTVVVTTGGFGRNPELVHAHIPDAVPADAVWSPSARTCVGDGLRLGAQVQAATAGHNHGDLLLTAGFGRDLEPYLPGWLVLVDGKGQRFVNELAPYAVVTPLAIEHGGSVWSIFDDRARTTATGLTGPWGAGTWTAEVLGAAVADGRAHSAPTLAQLAESIGAPPAALEATMQRYNRDCAAGRDTEFFKDPAQLRPMDTAPFHAIELRPSVVAVTGYGLRIDPDGRVLAESDGNPVPGLYAAGEVTGNVIGPQYLGGGNAIGSALIFGRTAGATAAADASAASA